MKYSFNVEPVDLYNHEAAPLLNFPLHEPKWNLSDMVIMQLQFAKFFFAKNH